MTPKFLAAVIDTLLPDEQRTPSEGITLPAGSGVDLDLDAYADVHRALLGAIASQAGGSEQFTRADEATRIGIVKAVERNEPDAFHGLLVAVLSDYYESERILAALRWRIDPPQPQGHDLPRFDDEAARLLERVKRRAKL